REPRREIARIAEEPQLQRAPRLHRAVPGHQRGVIDPPWRADAAARGGERGGGGGGEDGTPSEHGPSWPAARRGATRPAGYRASRRASARRIGRAALSRRAPDRRDRAAIGGLGLARDPDRERRALVPGARVGDLLRADVRRLGARIVP